MAPSLALDTFFKHPLARRAYVTTLHNVGTNTVSNLEGSSEPSGLDFESVTYDSGEKQVTALIGGGALGTQYIVTIEFDLSDGQHIVYTFFLIITI